jgi:hypothetical protein
MAINVGDAVLKITGDTSDLDRSLNGIEGNLKNIGLAAMAAGAAIIAGFGVAFKAAEEERIGIVKLSQALKNVGVSYDDVKESLEGVISATQRKTGIADDQQRNALRRLLVITGDYKKALDLLPLALDMASAMDMDLTMASQLLGRVMEGNVSVLTRYGIQLKEGTSAAEALAVIQAKVGGSAAAAMSPIELLGNTMGDLSEEIGGVLTPTINDLLKNNIIPMVEKMIEWVKMNPEVIKSVAALAVGLLAGGGIIFAMSMLSKVIAGVNAALIIMQSLTGVGIIKMLIGLGVAAGAIAGMNKLMETSTPEIPKYAAGGIVTKPQLAMVGEAGPEAIIPLSQKGFMGNSVTVNVGNYLGDEMSRRDLVRDIKTILDEENRRLVTPATRTDYYSVGGHL